MRHRIALLAVLVLCLAPTTLRPILEAPSARPPCEPSGRGRPPRGWLGCAADAGEARPLDAAEALVLGLPIDPNAADARALAHVPGLSRRLGEEIVRERSAHGPFHTLDELLRVRGIGPKRLAQARSALAIGPP